MTLTTNLLASYLGRPAEELLSLPPLSGWEWLRSVEKDLDSPLIDYVSQQQGMDFVCDESENVRTIFAYNEPIRRLVEGLDDVPFSFSRQQVQDRLGRPSKSGEPLNDSILGKFGAWDRFENGQFTIHIEYHLDSMSIKKITLMRGDVVP